MFRFHLMNCNSIGHIFKTSEIINRSFSNLDDRTIQLMEKPGFKPFAELKSTVNLHFKSKLKARLLGGNKQSTF